MDSKYAQYDDDDAPQPGKRRTRQRTYILKEDLTKMMQGFGEDDNPKDETVELMEIYVQEMITNLAKRANEKS